MWFSTSYELVLTPCSCSAQHCCCCMYFYLSIPPLLPRIDWQDWMWQPFLPGYCRMSNPKPPVVKCVSKSQWMALNGSFASCTNKWSSSCHQSKIDNSFDILYSIFWLLRGVGFSGDTSLSASLPLYLQRAFWKIRRMGVGVGGVWGGIEWKKKT